MNRVTVGALIDYLGQFDRDLEVVLREADFEGEGDFISLTMAVTDLGGRA